MNFIPCSVAFVLCLVLRVSSQPPPKPIGEWSPNRAESYPNPWVDSQGCKTQETSGLCDYNEMLNEAERKYFSDQPELKKVSDGIKCLCNLTCGEKFRINITVAIMKKIGPHITDYGAAAKEFAEKFRTLWSLNDCSVILVASKGDHTSFLDVGADVNSLLSVNLTENIYQNASNFFSAGLLVEGLNATLNNYRAHLKQTIQELEEQKKKEPQKSSGTKIIVGVIICILLIGIVAIIVIIALKTRKQKKCKLPAEDKVKQSLNAPEAV